MYRVGDTVARGAFSTRGRLGHDDGRNQGVAQLRSLSENGDDRLLCLAAMNMPTMNTVAMNDENEYQDHTERNHNCKLGREEIELGGMPTSESNKHRSKVCETRFKLRYTKSKQGDSKVRETKTRVVSEQGRFVSLTDRIDVRSEVVRLLGV